jgi:DNA polymerase-3 subunit gamma/tau
MAKKKSKGFIVPSVNFITVQAPEPKIGVPQEAPPISKRPEVNSAPIQEQVSNPSPEPTAEPVSKPVAPVPLKNGTKGRRKSALSLSSLKRKKQEEEEAQKKRAAQNKTGNLPQETFTEERFNTVWNGYIDSLHEGGEKILASILMADKPKVKGDMIHVTYPNQLMKTELLKVRPRVLKHIRRELNNHAVDFVIEVKEQSAKRFAYTPQEKYELLKEKNKDISLLRKTFNLEL